MYSVFEESKRGDRKQGNMQNTEVPNIAFSSVVFSKCTLLSVIYLHSRSRDSAVGIETGYGLDGQGVGVRILAGGRFFSSLRHPDRFLGPTSLLPNGYRGLFPRG
jgi:hypothetical protein